jgi:hypothetical protein
MSPGWELVVTDDASIAPARGFMVYCLDLFGISQQHSVMGAVVAKLVYTEKVLAGAELQKSSDSI